MKIITIILFLAVGFTAGAQKGWMWANLNKSPKVVIVSTNKQSGSGARTHSLTSVPAGALLIITTQAASQSTNASMSSSPSLTWTRRSDAHAAGSGNAEIWTTSFTAGGSITITSDFGPGVIQSSVAWVIRGQETIPLGAYAYASTQSIPSRTITTTRAGSLLICLTSDLNGVSGASRVYRDKATEVYYQSLTGTTGYHYYKEAANIATYTEGLTAPGGQSAGTAILEIRAADPSPLVNIIALNTQSGNGTRTHTVLTVPAGALLVVATQSEDALGNASISSNPSLTWTKRADAEAASSGNAEVWTATHTAGGTITITSNFGANNQSSVVWVITGQETTPGGATATATSQSSPQVAITSTRANSLLLCVSSDWNSVNGSARTYRDVSTEVLYHFSFQNHTGYHYYIRAGTVGTYTEGLLTPTGQSAGTVILEVRGP
jgi:hypothetical protein